MKKIKAFTFIELLVVISILAILMGGSIAYFGDFVDKMTLRNELSRIKDIIEDENNKIENKEIFDYKINFINNKNYFLIYENIVGNDITLKFNNLTNGTGSFSFSGVSSGNGIIKYYKDYKFQKKQEIFYNQSFTGNLSDKIDYRINGTFSGEILNNIMFDYYNYKENQNIEYIGTSTGIINILGNKNYDDLWLEFENDKGLKDKILIN